MMAKYKEYKGFLIGSVIDSKGKNAMQPIFYSKVPHVLLKFCAQMQKLKLSKFFFKFIKVKDWIFKRAGQLLY